MTVLFHGSFGLNREYMSGILKLALKDPKLKDFQHHPGTNQAMWNIEITSNG